MLMSERKSAKRQERCAMTSRQELIAKTASVTASRMDLVAATHSVVSKQQDVRGSKDGEMTVHGVFRCFVAFNKQSGRNEDLFEPPELKKQKVRNDPSKEYTVKMEMFVRVKQIPYVGELVKPRTDGRPGWRIRYVCKYWDEDTKRWLKTAAVDAWATDKPSRLQEKIREFVSREGVLTEFLYVEHNFDDQIKMKVPDSATSEFRAMNGDARVVQSCQPISYYNVKPEMWVQVKQRDVPDKENEVVDPRNCLPLRNLDAYAMAPAPAIQGLADVNVVAAAPVASAPEPNKEAAAPAAPAAAAVQKTHKETFIDGYCSLSAARFNVSDDYDPFMPLSERMHETYDAAQHRLVPIADWKARIVQPPETTAYFYVSKLFESDRSKPHGVDTARVKEADPSDFMGETSKGERYAKVTTRFDVFQWTGAPTANDPRYVVKVRDQTDFAWRQYGITDMEHYGMIISNMPEIPLHIIAKIWEGPTLEHEANKPSEMAKAVAKEPLLASIRGYYVYGQQEVIPDLYRYFCTQGIQLSAERVREEFNLWESVNQRTKKPVIQLKPFEGGAKAVNPVNVNGLLSAVIALGNGFCADPNSETGNDRGRFHAYDGNIWPLFEGRHRFYVLWSYGGMTDADRAQYCGKDLVYADDLLNRLKQTEKSFRYWIYAVRKNVRVAANFPRPAAAAPAPVVPVGEKREEREEKPRNEPPVADACGDNIDEDEDQEEESSSSSPQKRTKINDEE
jgi:hypothetical protein